MVTSPGTPHYWNAQLAPPLRNECPLYVHVGARGTPAKSKRWGKTFTERL